MIWDWLNFHKELGFILSAHRPVAFSLRTYLWSFGFRYKWGNFMTIWATVGISKRLWRNQLLISRFLFGTFFPRYGLDLTTLVLEELPEIINISTKKTSGIIYNICSVLAVSEGMSTPVSCEITLLSLVPPSEGCNHNTYSDSRRGGPKSLPGHYEELSHYVSQEPNSGSRHNLCFKPARTSY